MGQKVAAQDPIGNVTTYAYLPFGTLASVTDAAGNTVSYSYDPMGRKTGITDPDSGTRSATYFSTGELASTTEPGGTVGAAALSSTYSYDQLGRITSRTEPDLTSEWFYDANNNLGKLTTAVTTSGSTAGYPGGLVYGYSYDSLRRPSGTTLVFGTTTPAIGFGDSYVPVGQPGAGQLATVTDNNSGSAKTYGYTAQGYYQSMSRGPGGAPATNPVYAILSEDASQRPTNVTYGTTAFTNTLAAGTTSTVTDNYVYDQLFQLRQADNAATSKTFTYDAKGTGNLTDKSDTGSYTYGPAGGAGPHQLQSISGTVTASYTYDPRGNMLTGEDSAAYGWTSFNQPQSITKDVQYLLAHGLPQDIVIDVEIGMDQPIAHRNNRRPRH